MADYDFSGWPEGRFRCPHCGHGATFHVMGGAVSCGRCGLWSATADGAPWEYERAGPSDDPDSPSVSPSVLPSASRDAAVGAVRSALAASGEYLPGEVEGVCDVLTRAWGGPDAPDPPSATGAPPGKISRVDQLAAEGVGEASPRMLAAAWRDLADTTEAEDAVAAARFRAVADGIDAAAREGAARSGRRDYDAPGTSVACVDCGKPLTNCNAAPAGDLHVWCAERRAAMHAVDGMDDCPRCGGRHYDPDYCPPERTA